nr:MAG TPA: hypothetical protein [Caudoviricetes sp.]
MRRSTTRVLRVNLSSRLPARREMNSKDSRN